MYEVTAKDIEAIRDIAKASKNQYEAFVAILEYGVQLGEQGLLAGAEAVEVA